MRNGPTVATVATVAVAGIQGRTFETPTEAEAQIAEWRAAIINVQPDGPEFERLKSASLSFLDSPDAIAAVKNGWDAVSLFGLHKGGAPRGRIDAWGLVLFLAWGIHGHTVETINEKVCALRTRSGAVHQQPRSRENFDQAVPWWQHPAVKSGES